MVSVLIPVYNYDVSDLVKALEFQLSEIPNSEILILDDCSLPEIHVENMKLSRNSLLKISQNQKNVGRSATRNRLADQAQNDCLIFLDADTLPCESNFVQLYLGAFKSSEVIFGGIRYRDEIPADKNQYLRWFYGKNREEISAENRKAQGNRLFMTGNFCIRKDIFKTIRFNEKITKYGHEDTLFAYELSQKGIQIKHIENPAYHLGLETNCQFLKKTQIAVENMHHVNRLGDFSELLTGIRLWRTYKKYRLLKPIFQLCYVMFRAFLERNLCGNKPKLLYFDLLKLFGLAHSDRKKLFGNH